jgi:hypothetical protein
LSLTALEEYFLCEDRQAYPWSFFIRLEFQGAADQQAFERALNACVKRHPLLSAVVRRENGVLVWHPVDQPRPHVRWGGAGDEAAYPRAARLNVGEEIGIRAHVTTGRDHTQLIFQFHHAACDARGAMLFVEDWLAEYGRAMGDARDYGPLRRYDPALLPHRDHVGPALPAAQRTWRMRWTTLARAVRFLARTPAPLVDYEPRPVEEATSLAYPASVSVRFDAATTAQIRGAARRQGVTVNDLLCRDLFLSIRSFRRDLGEQADAWLRVVVPVDLRSHEHRTLSASNLTSLVFLTRHVEACEDSNALLRTIHEEMRQVKSWGLGRTFLQGLKLRRRLPGGIASGVRKRRCQATATLTNIGEVLAKSSLPQRDGRHVVGNLVLDGVDFLPPIRPFTCVSFSACTYAGRLALSLHYDHQGLSADSAERLMQLLIKQVKWSL